MPLIEQPVVRRLFGHDGTFDCFALRDRISPERCESPSDMASTKGHVDVRVTIDGEFTCPR